MKSVFQTLLVLIISANLISAQGVVPANFSSNSSSSSNPSNVLGIWSWDQQANGNEKRLSMTLNIFQISNDLKIKVQSTPQEVKDIYPNWIADGSDGNDQLELEWNASKNYYEVLVAGHVQKFSNGMEQKHRYLLRLTPNDKVDYILNGVLVKETSIIKQPRGSKVAIQPAAPQIMQQGVWLSRSKKAAAEKNVQQPVVVDPKFALTPEKLNQLLNPPSFQAKGNFGKNFSMPLAPAYGYVISLESIEALSVDSDDNSVEYKNKAEYIFDLDLEVQESGKRKTYIDNILVAIQGKSSAYGYPINNGLELNKPFELIENSFDFDITKSQFNQTSIVLKGTIAEVKMVPGSAYTNAINLNQTPRIIPLNTLKSGLNTVIFENGEKKLKLIFSIKSDN